MARLDMAPAERARLDSYARHMRTLLLSLFLVALVGNLIPRVEGAVPAQRRGGSLAERLAAANQERMSA